MATTWDDGNGGSHERRRGQRRRRSAADFSFAVSVNIAANIATAALAGIGALVLDGLGIIRLNDKIAEAVSQFLTTTAAVLTIGTMLILIARHIRAIWAGDRKKNLYPGRLRDHWEMRLMAVSAVFVLLTAVVQGLRK